MEMDQAKESLNRKTQEIISIETLSDVQLKIKCQLELELEEEKAKTIAQLHHIQTLQVLRQELQNRIVDRESQENDFNMESESEIQQTIKSLLNDLVDTVVNNEEVAIPHHNATLTDLLEATLWFPDIPDMQPCGGYDLETPSMYDPEENMSESDSELGQYFEEDK